MYQHGNKSYGRHSKCWRKDDTGDERTVAPIDPLRKNSRRNGPLIQVQLAYRAALFGLGVINALIGAVILYSAKDNWGRTDCCPAIDKLERDES